MIDLNPDVSPADVIAFALVIASTVLVILSHEDVGSFILIAVVGYYFGRSSARIPPSASSGAV